MEEDLPVGVQADPGEYAGEAGTAISIPLTDLTLDGGALLPGDFDWSLEDEDGTVGNGLSFQTDEPGRYELTLTGAYGDLTLTCPVVITVNKTIQLSNDIRLDKVYPDTDQTQYIGHVWVTGGDELGEGEEYAWTLERTGGDSVDLVIEDNGSAWTTPSSS